MGRKNKRKNNVIHSKAAQGTRVAESTRLKQTASDHPSAIPNKDEVSYQNGKNGSSAVPSQDLSLNGEIRRSACCGGEISKRVLQQEQDQQDQDGEDEEDQSGYDEGFQEEYSEDLVMGEHQNYAAPSKSVSTRGNLNLNQQCAFPQQFLLRKPNHISNEIQQNGCGGVGCSCRSEHPMIRRFERKEISKSWDESMKRMYHSHYQGDDDDDEQYEDAYEPQTRGLVAKPVYYNLQSQQQQQQQQAVEAKLQEKKLQRLYSNLLTQTAKSRRTWISSYVPTFIVCFSIKDAEDCRDCFHDDGDEDIQGQEEEYEEEVEEDEDEEEEEEDEEAGCGFQDNNRFQIPNKNRDLFDPLELLSYSKIIFKQQQQQLQSQLGQQQQQQSSGVLQQPMQELLKTQHGQPQILLPQNHKHLEIEGEDDEEEDEEDEEEDEEYATQIEAAYQGGYAFQEDKLKEHFRPLNLNANHCLHLEKAIAARAAAAKGSSQNHPFLQANAQNLNVQLQKQILLHQQQQQQQQKSAQQTIQMMNPQQQTTYSQQQTNIQQQQQYSPQQSTYYPQTMQQQQEYKRLSPQQQQQQPKCTQPGCTSHHNAHFVQKQPRQFQQTSLKSNNNNQTLHSNGSYLKGCKTPSTDDNSECLSSNVPALAATRGNTFMKSKKLVAEQQNGSIERPSPPSKPKAESEKKNYTPPQTQTHHQCNNSNSDGQQHHLNFLSQSKYKFVKDEYLDLDQILQKIYFYQYSYDELKEFVFPALREITNINSFFDILFNSIRLYAEEVKNQIHEQLKDIILSCFEGGDGAAQGMMNPLQQTANRIPSVGDFGQMIHRNFKRFQNQFLEITSQIYQQYAAVEEYSKQTEKIVHLYINHFIEKNRSIRFNCTDLHKRIFIFFVFNDQMISNYLEAKINFFKSKVVNGSSYNECLSQLSEMHNILVKKSQFIPSEEHPINIEIYEKETCDEEEGDEEVNIKEERYSPQTQVQQQNATINQKLLKKRSSKKNKNYQLKKQQQQQQMQLQIQQENDMNNGDQEDIQYYEDQVAQNGDYYGTSANGIMNENAEAKKKKKKKKKVKNGIVSLDAGQIPNGENYEILRENNTNIEQPKKDKKKGSNCPINEELDSFVRRLEESYRRLSDIPKIQPIISQAWIIKLKERYAKLKIRLNK